MKIASATWQKALVATNTDMKFACKHTRELVLGKRNVKNQSTVNPTERLAAITWQPGH